MQAQELAEAIRFSATGKFAGFYESRNYVPLWAWNGQIGPEADQFLAFLDTAEFDGLRSSTYNVSALRQAIAEARLRGDAHTIASAELMLSAAFARYVSDLRRDARGGLTFVEPGLLPPDSPREDDILRAAAFPRPFANYVSSMGWMSPHYVRMRVMYGQALQQGAPAEEQRRIRSNLDRARALPGPWTRHVVVDAASARLWYYQGGHLSGTMRVVVGKPSSPTPMLAGMLQYAIVNPYWNVPVDLAQTLIAPKVLRGRSLRQMNMEALSDWTANAQRLDPLAIDWKAVAAGSVELRLRQLPGPGNSMGKVKFMFPNDLGIYLHDTPERNLLTRANRHFSNGCIRLEDASGLGKWLTGQPVRIGQAPEQVVPVTAPVPVYITYFTATQGPNGTQFLADVYNRDGLEAGVTATSAR